MSNLGNLIRTDPAWATADRSSLPWSHDDRIQLVIGNALGAAMVFAGWWTVSDQVAPSDQLGWFNLSLTGLLVSGVANAIWLSRALRAVRTARRLVLINPSHLSRAKPCEPRDRPHDVVAVPGTSRYHRPDCLLVLGKTVEPACRTTSDRVPCDVCMP